MVGDVVPKVQATTKWGAAQSFDMLQIFLYPLLSFPPPLPVIPQCIHRLEDLLVCRLRYRISGRGVVPTRPLHGVVRHSLPLCPWGT